MEEEVGRERERGVVKMGTGARDRQRETERARDLALTAAAAARERAEKYGRRPWLPGSGRFDFDSERDATKHTHTHKLCRHYRNIPEVWNKFRTFTPLLNVLIRALGLVFL